jgi:hypothetical protein
MSIAARRHVIVLPLPKAWVDKNLLQLAVALIPSAIRAFLVQVPTGDATALLCELHRRLAERLAEVLRRREVIRAPTGRHRSRLRGGHFGLLSTFASLAHADRQLTVAELVAAERGASTTTTSVYSLGPQQLRQLKRRTAESLSGWFRHIHAYRLFLSNGGEPTVPLLFM